VFSALAFVLCIGPAASIADTPVVISDESAHESTEMYIRGANPGSPFLTFDAALTVPVTRGAEAFITAENIFGNRYEVGESADGVVTVGPPALVEVGMRVRF
jgi:hypothetical protein